MRISPSTHAADMNVGKRMKGNNGKIWIVILTSTGQHRWSPVVSTAGKCKCYPRADPEDRRLGAVWKGTCKDCTKWKVKMVKNKKIWKKVSF